MIIMYTTDQPEPGRILQIIAYSEMPEEDLSAKLTADKVQHIVFNGNASINTDYVDPALQIVKPRQRISVEGVPDKPLKADGIDKVTLVPDVPGTHVTVYMAGTLITEEDVGSDGVEVVTQSPGSYVFIFTAPFPYLECVVQVEAENEA